MGSKGRTCIKGKRKASDIILSEEGDEEGCRSWAAPDRRADMALLALLAPSREEVMGEFLCDSGELGEVGEPEPLF